MDKKTLYFEKSILSAKLGDKQKFQEIQKKTRFIENKVYNGFLELYPYLSQLKLQIYNSFYFDLMVNINEYNFGKDLFFDNLENRYIQSVKKFLIQYHSFPNHLIKDVKTVFKKKPPNRNRIIALQSFRHFTARQKLYVGLYFYTDFNLRQAKNDAYMKTFYFVVAIQRAFLKIRKNLIKVKSGSKREPYKEKIYRIFEKRILE